MERQIYKRGDMHPETMNIFWSYSNREKTLEGWLTPEAFQRKMNKQREYYRSEKGKAYHRSYWERTRGRKLPILRDAYRKKSIEYPLACIFNSIRIGARRRELEFSIDLPFIIGLWEKQDGKCAYTSIDMSPTYGIKRPDQLSIDRKDSTLGYTEENTVLCCQSINYMKNSYPLDDFINFLNKINVPTK